MWKKREDFGGNEIVRVGRGCWKEGRVFEMGKL